MKHGLKGKVVAGIAALGALVGAAEATTIDCIDPGTRESTFRIVGGSDAKAGDWPFIVGLAYDGVPNPYCGGSLIAQEWVLTAAHCFHEGMTDTSGIRLMDKSGKIAGDSIRIASVFRHPEFERKYIDGNENAPYLVNDVMLLKLDAPAPISMSNLAMLPTYDVEKRLSRVRTCAEVAGWGRGGYGDPDQPDHLQEINVKVLDNDVCEIGYGDAISSQNVCAGYAEGGKDSCQGDSGGPLIIRDGPTGFLQIGVVSFGAECALANYPGVYARASFFRDWIFEMVEENSP